MGIGDWGLGPIPPSNPVLIEEIKIENNNKISESINKNKKKKKKMIYLKLIKIMLNHRKKNQIQ